MKINILCLFIILIFFSSCSNDNTIEVNEKINNKKEIEQEKKQENDLLFNDDSFNKDLDNLFIEVLK